MDDMRAKVIDLDLNDILPNRFQPRIKFSEDSIIELSESIKEHGVIQPIIVRPIGDKYEIIAGERRYKASVLAGKDTIPAIISDIKDKECAEIALIENVQRRDLTAIEEAISYKKILDMGYLTQEQLAVRLGKSQSAVANKIRLLNLCDEVQEALMEEKISERHARSLLKIKEASKQKEMLERIINERLTVRKTEEEIEKMNNYISEPMNDMNMNMNNNQGGFSTVNPGLTVNNQPQNTNSSVDFSALLRSESAKPSNGNNPMPSAGGYQFDANGMVIGEPAAPNMSAPTSAPQTGYQFDANGVVIGENNPQPSYQFNNYNTIPAENKAYVEPGKTNYQFDANGVVIGESAAPNMSAPTPAPQTGYQFDANGMVMGEPAAPSMSAPTPAPQTGYQFDANGMVVGEPATPNMSAPTPVPQTGYQFDANGMVIGEPAAPSMSAPTPAPQTGYQFDANGMVIGEPAAPSMSVPAPTPQPSFQFDANGVVVGENSTSSMSAMPTTPIIENTTIASESMMNNSPEPSTFGLNVPPEPASFEPAPSQEPEEKPFSFNDLLATNSQREAQQNASMMSDFSGTSGVPTTPIVGQQLPDTFLDTTKNNDLDSLDGNNQNMSMSQILAPKDVATGDSLKEEKVDIQPIIITDYSKQYDPVLPQSQQPVERIDFKQIISLIRDVNDTIEKCGYTVETEEVDLENEYQVIFKINKN